ncbi:hypothetical protein [Pseudomonas sp.]|uniref:hypothetical protein n=1 Tax=Pseudomonas sp. TaxID=306 RepID=UPI003341CD0E
MSLGRLLIPRTTVSWWLYEAGAEVVRLQAEMAHAQLQRNLERVETLRRLQDLQLVEVRQWQRLAKQEGRPSYLFGIERDGQVTFTRPYDARFGARVSGPFCWLPAHAVPAVTTTSASEEEERAGAAGRGSGDLYVLVTRKVSLKNETQTASGAPA